MYPKTKLPVKPPKQYNAANQELCSVEYFPEEKVVSSAVLRMNGELLQPTVTPKVIDIKFTMQISHKM